MDRVRTGRPPRFAWVFIVATLVALAGVGGVAYWWHEYQQDQCRRSVQAREDNRAMWVFLIHRATVDPNDPNVQEFIKYLDQRLPPLVCRGTTPNPQGG